MLTVLILHNYSVFGHVLTSYLPWLIQLTLFLAIPYVEATLYKYGILIAIQALHYVLTPDRALRKNLLFVFGNIIQRPCSQ